MINKYFLVNFKSNKFITLISITLGMWKCEYNIFNVGTNWAGEKFGSYRYCGRGEVTII